MWRVFRCLFLVVLAQALLAGRCHAIHFHHTALRLKASFGTVGDNDVVAPAGKIPLVEGTDYGFSVRFRRHEGSIPVRVEIELPAAPKTWGDYETLAEVKISRDRKTETYSTDHDETDDEEFVQSWSVADGDPEGIYKIRLYIGDSKEPVRTFTFKVVKP